MKAGSLPSGIFPTGRRPERRDPLGRTLDAFDLLDLKRPSIGTDRSWWRMASGNLPMFTNDVEGSCTVAALAHSGRVASAAAGHQIVVSDADVREVYWAINGGFDQGAYMLDALRHVKRYGLGELRLLAYARIDLANRRAPEARLATLEISGSVYSGYALPRSAQVQTLWDVPSGGPTGDGAPWSWGGHAMASTAFDIYSERAQTWARTQRMTSRFVRTYCNASNGEAWLVLWEQGVRDDGRTPSGQSVDEAVAAADAIGRAA